MRARTVSCRSGGISIKRPLAFSLPLKYVFSWTNARQPAHRIKCLCTDAATAAASSRSTYASACFITSRQLRRARPGFPPKNVLHAFTAFSRLHHRDAQRAWNYSRNKWGRRGYLKAHEKAHQTRKHRFGFRFMRVLSFGRHARNGGGRFCLRCYGRRGVCNGISPNTACVR